MTEPRESQSLEARIHSENAPAGTPYAAHEMTDATPGPIVRFAVILAVCVVIVFAVTTPLFHYFARRGDAQGPPLHALAAERELPPDPRLQTNATAVAKSDENGFTDARWQDLQSRDVRTLSTYGWVDEQAGVVRVPIERAIELTLQRGLPATKPTSAPR